MRPDYIGVKYYSDNDLTLGTCFKTATEKLDAFVDEKEYNDINEIIELYNINLIIRSEGIKKEYSDPYYPAAKKLISVVARYFAQINDSTITDLYGSVCYSYTDQFWELFEKFKVYERISEETLYELLNESDVPLATVLKHKGIVDHYDTMLAEFMRSSEQTVRILTSKFLEKRDYKSNQVYYIPYSLRPNEFESIFDRYIDSENFNVGLLQLLSQSQSSAECPISDDLRLKAKKRAKRYWEDNATTGVKIEQGIGVCFADSEEYVSFQEIKPYHYQFTYDASWIRENLDYPTLLNNFIYLFEFTDLHFRCNFLSIYSNLSVFERAFGFTGIREYETGICYNIDEMKSSAEMDAYSSFLAKLNIQVEDLFQWFFTSYLENEFGISGFIVNMPSQNQTYLEKCRTLPSELDGILKQFTIYVRKGIIDRELLEISSQQIVFEAVPSMIENKYVYINSEEIMKELFLLFSDQSMLSFISETKTSYKSFYEALKCRELKLTDYPEWEVENLNWLKERGTIIIDEDGNIIMNRAKIELLRDLHEHEVVCPSYYFSRDLIDSLVSQGQLCYDSSLFSKPEQKYLNFMLNKAEYSNGRDLRNKYIHSSYPADQSQHHRDYISLLKIMVLTVIKINEEFCLKNPV